LTAPARGIVSVAVAATLWGVSGVVAKLLFRAGVAPEVLMAIRLSGAATVAIALLAIARPSVLRRAWTSWPSLALLGALIAMTQFSYYQAIYHSSVPIAIFLQYLAPMLLVLYARLAGLEPLTPERLGAVGASVVGSFLLIGDPGALVVTPAGIAWGLFSALCFAAYTINARRYGATLDPWAMLGIAMGFGAVLWIAVVPPWRAWAGPYPPASWWMIAHIVVVATLVPFALFLAGLRHISASVAGMAAMVEPAAGTAAAFLIFGDVLSLRQVAGCALILAAVAGLQRAAARSARKRD